MAAIRQSLDSGSGLGMRSGWVRGGTCVRIRAVHHDQTAPDVQMVPCVDVRDTTLSGRIAP